MKIGIMTFHWARNCGAVIQCFALQNFLREKGFDALVFDYIPQSRWRRLKNFLFGGSDIIMLFSRDAAFSLLAEEGKHLCMGRLYGRIGSGKNCVF